MKRDVRTHLEDADKAAEEIADFTSGTDLDEYLGNRMMQKAVERNLEIVGEALVRLRNDSPETAKRIPELKKVIGLRNVLIHKYDKVEPERIWHSILPALHEQRRTYQSLIAELGREGPGPDQRMAEDVLVLSCALTERIAPSPDESDFHRRLPMPVRDTLAAASKAVDVSQEAVDELAAKIARARAETDLRVKLTGEFSASTLHEFKARFEGHPRFSRGDMLDPYDAAIKERIATLDRTPPVPDDLERIVARAAVATAGTGDDGTAGKMVKALKCGTVPDAEEIRTRQKALLADLAQPGEIETDADKDRLAQEVYRCFTFEETRQICEGRGPFIQTLASDADRSRVTAGFRALHDFEIVGPAPWAGLHRTMQSMLAEPNAPGERRAGRSDPAEASRFPKHET